MPSVAAFILLLLCWPLLATAAQDDANANNTMSFITIDVAPWASVDPSSGRFVGAFPELIEAIGERSGLSMSISLTPFARVDRELESGDHDCTILIPRDESLVVPGELVSYHAIGVIAREGIVLREYDDMAGRAISVLRGASIHPRFDEDPTLDKQFDTDYAIALRKMERERIDVIAGAIPTIQFIAEQEGVADQLGDILQLAEVPLVFQCSRKSSQLDNMSAINQAIRDIKEDGTLEEIRQRHYF